MHGAKRTALICTLCAMRHALCKIQNWSGRNKSYKSSISKRPSN